MHFRGRMGALNRVAQVLRRQRARHQHDKRGSSKRLWLCSLAENRCADADAGGALFDRDFEIMGHAHGKKVHGDGGEPAGGNLIAQGAELPEIRSRALGIFGERRDRHQAAEL